MDKFYLLNATRLHLVFQRLHLLCPLTTFFNLIRLPFCVFMAYTPLEHKAFGLRYRPQNGKNNASCQRLSHNIELMV